MEPGKKPWNKRSVNVTRKLSSLADNSFFSFAVFSTGVKVTDDLKINKTIPQLKSAIFRAGISNRTTHKLSASVSNGYVYHLSLANHKETSSLLGVNGFFQNWEGSYEHGEEEAETTSWLEYNLEQPFVQHCDNSKI